MLPVRGSGRRYSYQFNENHSLAQENMPPFIRKGNSSPGAGTHQKLGPRRSCLLQSEMLLIRSSLGSLLRSCPEELGRPLTLIWLSVQDNNSLWVSADISLLLKMQERLNFIYLYIFLSRGIECHSTLYVLNKVEVCKTWSYRYFRS